MIAHSPQTKKFTPFTVTLKEPVYDTFNQQPFTIPQGWQVKVYAQPTNSTYKAKAIASNGKQVKFVATAQQLGLLKPSEAETDSIIELEPESNLDPPVGQGKNKALTPRIYQEYGISFLLYKQRAILADAPGVGKTLQALEAAHRVHTANMLSCDPLELCYPRAFTLTDENETHPTQKPEWATHERQTHTKTTHEYNKTTVTVSEKVSQFYWDKTRNPVTVIVAPGHLCTMWYDSIRRQYPNEYVVLATGGGSSKRERLDAIKPGASFYIVNYEMMRAPKEPKDSDYIMQDIPTNINGKILNIRQKVLNPNYKAPETFVDRLTALNPACIIFDEAHRLKSRKSKQAQECDKFARNIPYVFMLTATIIKREADDMFFPLHILDPQTFEEHDYTLFLNQFCLYEQTSWNKRNIRLRDAAKRRLWFNRIESLENTQTQLSYTQQATTKTSKKYRTSFTNPNLKGYVLGRSYNDVGLYLPPLMQATIPVELDPPIRKMYDQLKLSYRIALDESEADFTIDSYMGMLHGLRVLTSCPNKYKAVNEIIEDNDGPFVIFTEYRPSGEQLASMLDTPFISGSIPEHEREALIANTLRQGKPIVGMGRVIGTGINALADANVIINFEHDYTPGERTQRIGRVQRYSPNRPENQPVLLFDLVTQDTIDAHVYKTQQDRGHSIKDIIKVELGLAAK